MPFQTLVGFAKMIRHLYLNIVCLYFNIVLFNCHSHIHIFINGDSCHYRYTIVSSNGFNTSITVYECMFRLNNSYVAVRGGGWVK